jgi:hydrogenase expression/formation protein HypC
MCLGIPGQVSRWIDVDPLMASAEIDFGGVKKRCQMACVPEAREGDYVLVHATNRVKPEFARPPRDR